MDYKKSGGGKPGKNRPKFRDDNAPGGRNNPFGGKTRPADKADPAKPEDDRKPGKS